MTNATVSLCVLSDVNDNTNFPGFSLAFVMRTIPHCFEEQLSQSTLRAAIDIEYRWFIFVDHVPYNL